MRVSVIVTLYKDIEAISLILDALKQQTYKDFEVVIAEDDDSEKAKQFIDSYEGLDIKHVSHKDIGRTKTVIQNKAICASEGEYLVFIDGDVIPYSTFIEAQLAIARPGRVLSGRRVHLDEALSKRVRSGALEASKIEKYFPIYAISMLFDRESRFEQGIYLDPTGWFYRTFLGQRKRNASIIGCNWSCYKSDMLKINGFDESYGLSCIGDDTDLDWRFKSSGCELYSSKNIANVLHLHHKVILTGYDATKELSWFHERQEADQFRCVQGLDQYC